jgi:hypothetical protein
MGKNTLNSENSVFGKPNDKSTETHLSVVTTVSVDHQASLSVDLVPVEPLLWPRYRQSDKICEQATQYDTFIDRSNSHLAVTQQHESDDGA